MKLLSTNLRKKQAAFLLIVALTLGGAFLATLSQSVQEIENRTWDWRLKLSAGEPDPAQKIKIILIDQHALDLGEQEGYTWPWPRVLYVPVIEYLKTAGAKGLAFDLLFTESSSHGASEDRELGEATGSGLPIVSIASVSRNERESSPEKLKVFRKRQAEEQARTGFAERYLQHPATPRYNSVTLPVLEILNHSTAFGNVTAEPDGDGIFRHFHAGGYVGDIPFLNSPVAFYNMIYGKDSGYDLDDYLDSQGRLTLKFRKPHDIYHPVSIKAIIDSYVDMQEGREPRVALEEYRDAWVFLGVGAPGLFDFRPTPLNERAKGIEIIATVLDNLISRSFVKKTPAVVNILYALMSVVTVVLVALFVSSAVMQVLMIGAAFLLQIAVAVLLVFSGYWILFVIPFAATFAALLLSFAFQFQLEGRQHRFIKDAFRFYVSPSVIEEIVNDPSVLSLGGAKRELTIFFSDIAGFTSISERIEANKLVPLINTFLTEMTAIIQDSGGTVDKYVGDAIVAFWNAPVLIPDHAERAVRAAIDCQVKLASLQEHFLQEYGVPIKMRIGLHTGVVSVGNFGSKDRFNYTVVGDAANLASRLEGANKYFGTYILFSGTTAESLNGLIPTRKVAEIKVVGKSEIVTVFEPDYEGAAWQDLDRYNEAMAAYHGGDLTGARDLFRSIPKDPVARVYMSKIERELSREDGPGDWSPVWNLSEK